MSETRFTPGPWKTYLNDSQVGVAATASGIAALWLDGPERTANAHLIAAAPELYAALQGMFDLVCVLGYEVGDGERPILKDGVSDQKMNEARAALKKARGEE